MDCPACNAFADRSGVGGIAGVYRPENVRTVDEQLSRYAAGLTFEHPDLLHIQLILYDLTRDTPDVADAKLWAEHFRFVDDPNVIVLVPDVDPRNRKSFDTIPGYWLVDRDLAVVSDWTGHSKANSLVDHLMPRLVKLVNGT